METKLKLCIECKYHRSSSSILDGGVVKHWCTHPEFADPVDGLPILCGTARTDSYYCLDGIKWEEQNNTKNP